MMAVKDWHPGKLGLMWLGYLVLLWFLREWTHDDEALVLWAFLAIPGAVITWRWFSAREKND